LKSFSSVLGYSAPQEDHMLKITLVVVACTALSAQNQQPAYEWPRIVDIRSLRAVSMQSLAHKVPKAARKELDKGLQAWLKGRSAEAVAHLAQAATLDPDSVEAQADLGVAYAALGNLSQALDRAERAIALEPRFHVLHENKAAVLMMLNRLEEAEQAARKALSLSPESIDANYTLGMALIMRGKLTVEALDSLERAAKKDDRARKALESVQSYAGNAAAVP
jgi:tetratricopeptide (TPR) repeat protein